MSTNNERRSKRLAELDTKQTYGNCFESDNDDVDDKMEIYEDNDSDIEMKDADNTNKKKQQTKQQKKKAGKKKGKSALGDSNNSNNTKKKNKKTTTQITPNGNVVHGGYGKRGNDISNLDKALESRGSRVRRERNSRMQQFEWDNSGRQKKKISDAYEKEQAARANGNTEEEGELKTPELAGDLRTTNNKTISLLQVEQIKHKKAYTNRGLDDLEEKMTTTAEGGDMLESLESMRISNKTELQQGKKNLRGFLGTADEALATREKLSDEKLKAAKVEKEMEFNSTLFTQVKAMRQRHLEVVKERANEEPDYSHLTKEEQRVEYHRIVDSMPPRRKVPYLQQMPQQVREVKEAREKEVEEIEKKVQALRRKKAAIIAGMAKYDADIAEKLQQEEMAKYDVEQVQEETNSVD